MRLALYQPDIPQNTGTIVRLCACFGVPLDIIEPCGFTFTDKQLARAAMDYAPIADIKRHTSWEAFETEVADRLILLTTQAAKAHIATDFRRDDILLLGSESAGVPDDVHARADLRVRIPMASGARSLNVAVAAGIVLAEALRQTQAFPDMERG